jgi:hypothetical protein
MDLYFFCSNELLYIILACLTIFLVDLIFSTRSFEPLWGVLRAATDKLANVHHTVVVKLQELSKEVKEYGDKQKERHKAVSI